MSALVLPGDGRPPDAHPRHNTAGGRIHSAPGPPLPVRRVVLYKTGVGYFEHLGTVRDRQDVAVRFTSAQLNDVLKSLTTIDLGKGRISGISYNSIAPVEQRLGALRLPVGATTTAFDLLGSLRGARVQVTSGAGVVEGRLLSVERRNQLQRDTPTTVESLIPPDLGELRSLDLTPAVRIRIIDRDLRQEVGRYLDVVGSSREQDVRRMVISSAGTGERQLFVSYISEVPIWKSTYRLVIPDKGNPCCRVGRSSTTRLARTGATSSCRSWPAPPSRSSSRFHSRITDGGRSFLFRMRRRWCRRRTRRR